MTDEVSVVAPASSGSVMEGGVTQPIDPARQFRVVSLVAMGVAAPFIIGHLLIGSFGFPYLATVFAAEALPVPTALMLSVGWLAGPVLVAVDVATFWLLYQWARRWWIGLLFVPAFIYLMMMAFMGFLSYIPLLPLVGLQ